jgi:type II restriction enzyme
MNLSLEANISSRYHSNSQRARVITEHWLSQNMFCPICGAEHLTQFVANKPVADFYCNNCRQEYELKSKEAMSIGSKISDGAYSTMIERITSNNNPNLFCMSHSDDTVNNLVLIPRYFFTPSIIIKRKPLADTARRAGWIGCNIDISTIPQDCKINIVKSGVACDKSTILSDYNRIKSLQVDNIESRGWLLDVLFCVSNIKTEIFSLEQVYRFEKFLAEKHPDNRFIRAKIRQQLQLLRDRGYINFLGRGLYQKKQNPIA